MKQREGPSKASTQLEDTLKRQFGDGVCFVEVDNYVSIGCFGGASQPVDVSLHDNAEIFRVPVQREVDAVIVRFDVQREGHGKVRVVTGNMHIVCRRRPPSIAQRQSAVRALRVHLDGMAVRSRTRRSCESWLATTKLNSRELQEALQMVEDDEALWQVFATAADRNGDNVAVSGAEARFRPIAVGVPFADCGMRHDSHDAVAVVIEPRGASQPAEESLPPVPLSPVPSSTAETDWSLVPSATSEADWALSGSACHGVPGLSLIHI